VHLNLPTFAAELDDGLCRRVLARLGFDGPPAADLDGLRALYRAWCARVPFDNVRKMIALGKDGPLPGGDATDLLEHWLADGAAGTCWPTSNALFALLEATGFAARRITASMRDTGTANHASVKVALDGRDWLVDSSLLTNVPLPLGPGVLTHDDPAIRVEVEESVGTHVIWAFTPPDSSYLPCRLLDDPATAAAYAAGYEASRAHSPFNQRLYARRNRPGELVVIVGSSRFSKTAAGVTGRDLVPNELVRSLRDDIGLSESLIEEWARAGGLEASYQAPRGPRPPRVIGRPPSQRV
jgi:N-hydroxyarylamine O-acetyltransferase